jgi:hypothetical protein
LKPHVPTLLNGHLQVIAEDGNLYTYPKEQYSAFLAAGKTMDALFVPTAAGTYPLFDRSMYLTANGVTDGGMYSLLEVADVVGLPVAVAGPDQTGITVGNLVILAGASIPTGATFSWSFTSVPGGSTAVLSGATTANPTFTPNTAGTYVVQLVVNDGALDSVADSVTITTNLPPVANAGPDSTVAVSDLVTLDGRGSIDPDTAPNPTLTYSWVLNPIPTGSTAELSDPFSDRPTFTPNTAGTYVVQLVVSDGAVTSAPDTVTITAADPVNQPPVAVDDTETTQRGVGVTIDLIANDYDPDDPAETFGRDPGSTIDPASVNITNEPNRGGTVNNLGDGTVTYTSPTKGFNRGTDVFTYTVSDFDGNVSTEATVRVNVVK